MKFNTFIKEKYIKSFLDPISKDYDLPLYLYHASYKALKEDILERGLRPCQKYRSYNWCTNGIYLGVNEQFCVSFLDSGGEADTNVPEDWYGDYIVFRVLSTNLNRNRLFRDPNWKVSGESIDSFIYKGIILPNKLEIYE